MPKSAEFERELKKLRREIDRCDRALVRALAGRMRVVRRIGRLKKRHGMPVVQLARFDVVFESRVQAARKSGLNADFAGRVLRLIHTEAIRIQRKMGKTNGKR